MNFEEQLKTCPLQVSENVFFTEEKKTSDKTIRLININCEEEYYRITKVAAELFLIFHAHQKPVLFQNVVDLLATKVGEKHKDKIYAEGSELIKKLLEKKLVLFVEGK